MSEVAIKQDKADIVKPFYTETRTGASEKAGERWFIDHLDGNFSWIQLSISPTNNCQLFTIGWFSVLLNKFKDPEVIEWVKEAKRKTGKNLLLLDIRKEYKDRIKNLFSNILIQENYDSTNNSKMCLFLINLKGI